MTTDNFQRKLTAILSADVAGYSRLMGEDEEATVRTITKYKEIIFGLIKGHHGRLADSPGDNDFVCEWYISYNLSYILELINNDVNCIIFWLLISKPFYALL
jgi:hypothetical protein